MNDINAINDKDKDKNPTQDKDIIISQEWGGLGDNLQYSILPELYSNEGYDVYISSNNNCRNNEIFEIVWKSNPYIKGVSLKKPNAGQIKN